MRNKATIVYGVGINDSTYSVSKIVNGKRVNCPYYNKWRHMIERCYSLKYQEKNHTYNGCTVCREWLYFSSFKRWMETQDWEGKDLDKDILLKHNKIYSPETCIFVSPSINKLLNKNAAIRGDFPIGVCLDKNKKIMAQCKVNGKMVYLGVHKSVDLAHKAYKCFKYKVITAIAINESEPLRSALINYKIEEY